MNVFALTIVITATGLTMGTNARAQNDAKISSENQMSQYWQTHKSDLKLEENYREVPVSEVPSKLQKTLDGNELYKGWQHAPLYIDKDTNIYTLYIKKDSTVTMYGFNEYGKAVTYDSYTVHDQ